MKSPSTDTREFFRWDGASTTLVLMLEARGVPELLYWGSRLPPECALGQLHDISARPLPFGSLDREAPLSLMPEESRGFPGVAGLAAHRQGRGFTHRFQLSEIKPMKEGLSFCLEDRPAGLALRIHCEWREAHEILGLRAELENIGSEPLQVEHLACPNLPLPASFSEALLLHGRWAGEFQMARQQLSAAAALLIESHSGRTGPEHFPAAVLGEKNFDELQGELMGIHLAWSGNYRLRIERLADGRGYVQASELLFPGELQLGPGETYSTPQLWASRGVGLETMSQRFHSFLRQAILPSYSRQARPVLANSWEAVYFDHSFERLQKLVEAAAAIGVERFVLDDGWFRGRRHDRAGLGDWQVDPEVYPDGLGPLIEAVEQRGMSFGLWVEPEMLNPDSELFRQHPDWVLQTPGYPAVSARHQLVLNLSDAGAFSYIENCLKQLLANYKIAFLKWDMNRVLVMAADQAGRPAAQRQMQAVYRLFDSLRASYPKLEIESCASGGGRADFEILRRCGRVWTSDNNDPLTRLAIHRGFSLFFPPEIMGAHIGAEKAHITGRVSDLHMRAIVALQGQLGFELDLRLSSAEDRAIMQQYVEIYKEHREWIGSCRVHRLKLSDPALKGLGYVAADQKRSLWWLSAEGSLQSSLPEALKLRGLKPQSLYRLRLENRNREALLRFMQKAPQLLSEPEGLLISGALLMQVGIALPVLPPQLVLLLSCQAV